MFNEIFDNQKKDVPHVKLTDEQVNTAIKQLIDVGEQVRVMRFRNARKVLTDIMERDLELRFAWHANIAMLLHDSQHWDGNGELLDFTDKETRDKVAERIMKLVFE